MVESKLEAKLFQSNITMVDKYVYNNQVDSIKINVEEDNKTVITVPFTEDHLLIMPSGHLGKSLYRGYHGGASVYGFVPSNRS